MEKSLFILILSASFLYSGAQNYHRKADSLISFFNIPELAFAKVSKDSIYDIGVVGYNKINETNLSNEANTDDFFHIGSLTKAITSFIAAYLVEQHEIEWDTKFFDLYPELKKNSNSEYYNITLLDLLSHRAKIQPFTSGVEYKNLPQFLGNKQQQRKKFVEEVLTLPAYTDTNKKYRYSNAGYSVAALMLEKVSSKSWEQLVDIILKQKLDLDYVLGWPNRNYDSQPWGHWLENGNLIPVPPNSDYCLKLAEPAGDISLRIHDMAKFLQLNIQGLSGQDNLLKSKTYQFLHCGLDYYSIGWVNYSTEKQKISEHTGSDGTFFCYVQIDRIKHLGYVIMVNSGTKKAQEGVLKIMEILKNK